MCGTFMSVCWTGMVTVVGETALSELDVIYTVKLVEENYPVVFLYQCIAANLKNV